MKMATLYFKTQFTYWLILFLVFVLPLILFFQFSSYPLPKVQYVFLGALFISQYVFYREKEWMKSKEAIVIAQLKKELNKVPSTQEIINRQHLLSSFRNIVIAETAFEILLVMFWYKQF
jgi:hypothetical protein